MDGGTGAAAYRDEEVLRARASGLLAGLVAVVGVPAWGVFDAVLEPELARSFAVARATSEVPMLLALWWLWRHPLGRRRPEPLIFLIAATVQAEVAFMIPRVGDHLELYVLGFSLALYAAGTLLAWHPRWTAGLVGFTWAALGVAVVTAPDPMAGDDLLGTAFYLSTASTIAVLAQLHRHRTTQREFAARSELEREQERNRVLLEELDRLSHEDPLTGLANRRRWDVELERACADAGRTGASVAVALVDIDRFKEINDICGHAGGDAALQAVAEVLHSRLRRNDLAARLGGDEFGLLLVGTDAAGAASLVEQLADAARGLRLFGPGGPPITLSVGVAAAAGAACGSVELLGRADQHLYRAKATRDAVSVAGAV